MGRRGLRHIVWAMSMAWPFALTAGMVYLSVLTTPGVSGRSVERHPHSEVAARAGRGRAWALPVKAARPRPTVFALTFSAPLNEMPRRLTFT